MFVRFLLLRLFACVRNRKHNKQREGPVQHFTLKAMLEEFFLTNKYRTTEFLAMLLANCSNGVLNGKYKTILGFAALIPQGSEGGLASLLSRSENV